MGFCSLKIVGLLLRGLLERAFESDLRDFRWGGGVNWIKSYSSVCGGGVGGLILSLQESKAPFLHPNNLFVVVNYYFFAVL